MITTPPKLIIFAGANGAGKTTAAEYLIPRLKIKEFVNADEIARGLSPFDPAKQGSEAGKIVVQRTDKLIAEGKSFAIETTLAGRTLAARIKRARKAGYIIEMHYMFCADINMNLRRITLRVKQGGHHVPADDVRRRYWRSLKNLSRVYGALCDKITLYDTTSGDLIAFAQKDGYGHPYSGSAEEAEKVLRFFDKVNEALDEH